MYSPELFLPRLWKERVIGFVQFDCGDDDSDDDSDDDGDDDDDNSGDDGLKQNHVETS